MPEVPNLKNYIKKTAGGSELAFTANYNPLGWVLSPDDMGPSPALRVDSNGMSTEDFERLVGKAFEDGAAYATANGLPTPEMGSYLLFVELWQTEFNYGIQPNALLAMVTSRADVLTATVRNLTDRVAALENPVTDI